VRRRGVSCYAAGVPLRTMRNWINLGAGSVASALLLAGTLSGCSHASPAPATQQNGAAEIARQQARAEAKARALDRQDLDQIPPPSKSRYLAIHTKESWQNPFLVVGKSTVNLQMMYPDQGQSDTIPNTMLRPAGARRRTLDLRLSDLPEALAALPQDAWPYGRVIAVEEDPSAPKADRAQVRRNEEATLQVLNDLGVVIYDWPGNGMGH
jgi:hypothetical protein